MRSTQRDTNEALFPLTPFLANRKPVIPSPISLACSLLTMCVGAVVLCGWIFKIDDLRTLFPTLPSMKGNTALALAVIGIASALGPFARGPRLKALVMGLLVFVTALALATLAEYTFNISLGIDELLFKDPFTPSFRYPGRFSMATATALLLAVVCVPIRRVNNRVGHSIVVICSSLGLSIALFSLFNIVYDQQGFYNSVFFGTIAPHTAATFCVLFVGFLSSGSGDSLRLRVMALAVLVLAPLMSLMIYFAHADRSAAFQSAQDRAALFADSLAREEGALVDQAKSLLDHLSRLQAVKTMDAGCGAALSDFSGFYSWINWLGVLKPDGEALCTNRAASQNITIADRPYFQDALIRKEFVLSGFLIGRQSGKPGLAAALPVLDKETITGVLAIAIDLSAFNDLSERMSAQSGATITVLDENGVVIAHEPKEPGLIGRNLSGYAVVQHVLNSGSGRIELPDWEGRDRLFAYSPLLGTSSSILVGFDRQAIAGPIDAALKKRLWLIVLVVSSAVAIGLISGEFLVFRPLRLLTDTAERLGRGELDARPAITGSGEVRVLTRALARMADAIADRERQLAETEALFRGLFEHSTDALFVYKIDAEGRIRIEAINDTAAKTSGPIVQKPVGRRLEDAFSASLTALTQADLVHVLSKGEPVRFERNATVNGQPCASDIVQIPLCDADGTINRVFVSRRDITHLREAEAEVRLRERHVQALRQIAEAANAASHFQNAVDRMLATFGALIHADRGGAFSLPDENGHWALAWHKTGYGPSPVDSIEPVEAWLRQAVTDRCVQFQVAGSSFPDDKERDWRIALPVFQNDRFVACLTWCGTVWLGSNPNPTGPDKLTSFDADTLKDLATYAASQLSQVAERQSILDTMHEALVRHKAIFDSAIDAIITLNESGSVETFNPAAERLFGYGAAEIARRSIGLLLPADEAAKTSFSPPADTLAALGRVREATAARKDGSTFPADIALSEMRIGERRFFVAIIRDISERKRIEQMKTEFVSTVSHELRTPLTSISGSLSLLSGGAIGVLPGPAARLVDLARKNTDRLIRLINDILDIEKIEAGRVDFEMKPVEMCTLLEGAIEANRGFADGYGVRVALAPLPDAAFVSGDADRLTQILTNLFSNAIKFSPSGGEVKAGLERKGDRLRIWVRDQGAGIPESFHNRIFSKFAQADSSDTRQKGGTGLGLSIVKEIVERLGGHISFETGPEWGTEFSVDLPALDSALEKQPAIDARASDDFPLVLVHAHDAAVAETVEKAMEQVQLRCVCRNTLASTFKAIQEHTFNAVFIDLCPLPEGGLTVIRDIRAHPHMKTTPLIVTGICNEDRSSHSEETAPHLNWLESPLDTERLLEIVRLVLVDGTPQQLSVLHLDDDPDVLQVVSTALASIADVTSVGTLDAARDALKERTFTLVILDIALTKGSGLDLLPFLKEGGQHMPRTIIFSAQDADPAHARHVDAVLTKSQASLQTLSETVLRLARKSSVAPLEKCA